MRADFQAERDAMLGLNGRASEMDVFRFFLASELGKTVGELDGMPYPEYVEWRAYWTAKRAIEGMREVG